MTLRTEAGDVACRYHPSTGPEGGAGLVWVFGAGGGFGGPAGGLYERLGRQLAPEGVASLELDYRRSGYLESCVRDVLAGVAFLENEGHERVILVGHSFGGAVVIRAAPESAAVVAVAALSSQTRGTEHVGRLRGRSLLLLHGEDDEELPAAGSRAIFERARDPKAIILYPKCRHGLDACRDEVDRDLLAWLHKVGRTPAR
ncbi:MAG TPA: alpha/beta fold hydrolase [Polyangiaceae bacterium]|nr:alpha/beta fold hydrolase [Polyangiaceae bacterium]